MPRPGSMSKEDMMSLRATIKAQDGVQAEKRDRSIIQGEVGAGARLHYLSLARECDRLIQLPALSTDDVEEIRGHQQVIQDVLAQADVSEESVRIATTAIRLLTKQYDGRSPEAIKRREEEIESYKHNFELLKQRGQGAHA